MTTPDTLSVAGSFDDPARARTAVDELLRAGFRHDQLGWVHKNPGGAAPTVTMADDTAPEEGATVGAVAGGTLGGLLGAVLALTTPLTGPLLAAGVLAGLLSGATIGITGGGLLGALLGLGFSQEEADTLQREVQAGRTLVTVKAEGRHVEAAAILSRCGAYTRPSVPSPAGV